MKDADEDRVQQAVNILIEHFDSVQIFVSRCESGELDGTVTVAKGSGNWFARYGQVAQWVIYQDEKTRNDVPK